MKEIRLYQNDDLKQQEIKLNTRNYKYLTKVLRFKGDKITLFNGDGYDYLAIIKKNDKDLIAVIIDKIFNSNESKLNITLIQAIAKGEKMDYIIQKSTELGVSTIIPIITSRVIVKLNDNKKIKKMKHWQEIAINASEQCNRAVVPKIKNITNFDKIMQKSFVNAFVLNHRSDKNLLTYKAQENAVILIGPEGGLSKNEINLALNKGFNNLMLGSRVLRTETASLVSIANLQLLWGS